MKKYTVIICSLFLGTLMLTSSSCKKEKSITVIQKGALTVSPVDFNEFVGLVPLGAMNPPSHTFPTDHMYFYYKNVGIPHNIKSPGNMSITAISRNRRDVNKPGETTDYTIEFGDTDEILFYFYHVSTLSKKLLNATDNFSGTNFESYKVNGIEYEKCRKTVVLDVVAGEVIGTGNTVPNQFALDMGMRVNGVAVCPLDYFEPTIKKELENRLSNFSGTKKKVGLPLCGEVNQNLPGTAQGNWLKNGSPQFPEDPHIALAKNEIDPSIPVFSIGNGLPGQASGTYTFAKLGFGFINRPFNEVKADGKVYCYNIKKVNEDILIPNASIILKMENENSLSVERRNCDCAVQPYVFTGNKVGFTKDK